MEPEKTPPGSPVADVDDVAARLKAKAHVSPAGEKPKRRLESPDKAPRNRPASQKTTADPNDRGIFKASPMKPPSAGEYGAAAATPAEPAAAAEEKKDEAVLEEAPPPLPPRRAVVDMGSDDESDDDIVDPIFQVVPAPEAIDATAQQGGADADVGASLISVGSSARGEGVNLIFNESHVLASDGARATFSLSSSVGRLDGCCAVLVRYTSRGVEVYGLTTQEARILRMDGSVDDLRTASFVPMMDSDSLLLDQGQVAARPAQFAYRLRIGPSSMNGNEPGSLDAPMAAASPALDAPVDEAMAPMSEEEAVDLAVAAMDTDAQRLRFGVPVTCPVVAVAPQIAIRTWRVPPQPDPVLLLTSSTTLQTDTFRVLHEWAYQDDQALATILRVLRLVPSRTTTRDYALLARDEPEGRALLELVSHDAALRICRQFAEDARATPVVLSDLRWGTPVEIHPMSHAIACWKADAHDERLHELLEAASYCERVKAGTETLDWRREKRLEALARASPLWSPEDRTTFNGIRKTSQQSAALQKVLYLGRRLRSYAADDRAAERLVENRERYLRERDASRQVARGLLSRAGRLEALYLETNSMLRELDTLTWLRLGPLFNEARTLDVGFRQPRGTTRELAKAFLVVLAGALDESPAQEQVKARAEAYENKWKPTENSDLVVAAHEATLTTFEHDDLFAFDPLRWNDADVDASRAALREHDVQPRGRWATHRGMIQPGLIAEDPPETLRDGPAFHASHYRPETAEDIARDLRRGGV